MDYEHKAVDELRSRVAEARAHLLKEMFARGMHEADGWRIVEFTRPARGGLEMVIRPMHLRLQAPADLECVIFVGEEQGEVDLTCEPDQA